MLHLFMSTLIQEVALIDDRQIWCVRTLLTAKFACSCSCDKLAAYLGSRSCPGIILALLQLQAPVLYWLLMYYMHVVHPMHCLSGHELVC